MIEVREAVRLAIQEAQIFFEGSQLIDLSLEEVELTDDERYWLITLGYYVQNINPAQNKFALAIEGERKYIRKYKKFKIDANSGRFVSMKIREPSQG